ncbi:hypothetical protein ABZ341_08900 [Streptomyces sp. NPDC006173]
MRSSVSRVQIAQLGSGASTLSGSGDRPALHRRAVVTAVGVVTAP